MVEEMTRTLTKENLFVFRDLIQTRTGLFFPESKFYAIEKILQANFENATFENFSDYVLFLESAGGERPLKNLISLLTTNETYFFRGKSHFALLEKHILPKIIQREAAAAKNISIWSAGCSTGEEPYSIAILLKKLIPHVDQWNVRILGTDIDEGALNKAVKGEYGQWSFRGLDSGMIMDSFGKTGDVYCVHQSYKSLVSFQIHNLILDQPPRAETRDGKFDIIFCRNVTIYFKKETTKVLASKFYSVLREGGYLIVGDAEHSAENYPLFKSKTFPGAIIYQKNGDEDPTLVLDMPLYQGLHFSKKNKGHEFPVNGDGTRLIIKHARRKKAGQEREGLLKFIQRNRSKRTQQGISLKVLEKQMKTIEKQNTSVEERRIFNEAMQYYFEKQYEMAIDRFLRIVDINPETASACWMLAHIASNRGDFEEAIAWAERSIKIDSLLKEPYYTLSTIYMARGELDRAMERIKKALYIDQEFILGHFVMGSIFRLMRFSSEAEKCFQKVKNLVSSKATDEVIFETEFLAVGILIKSLELKA